MTKAIDLTYEIYLNMKVYPGDPKVKIKQFTKIKEAGWKVSRIDFGTHTGTHIDAPAHMIEKGKTLSNYSIDTFWGNAILIEKEKDIRKSKILIFNRRQINKPSILNKIIKIKPKLVGFSYETSCSINTLKKLLESDILVVSPLKIGKNLPKKFQFFALPLKIKDADGSPTRAIALF